MRSLYAVLVLVFPAEWDADKSSSFTACQDKMSINDPCKLLLLETVCLCYNSTQYRTCQAIQMPFQHTTTQQMHADVHHNVPFYLDCIVLIG